MIPKRIFYVWGAGEKKRRDVNLCIQSWRSIMPDYEIIEINEDSTQYFDFKQNLRDSKFFRTVYKNKMWAYVADYIRIKVLHDHGGIYFDTDVSVLKPFDEFLSLPAFVGMQNETKTEPAILGAQAHNPLLRRVLDFYNDGFWRMPIFTLPDIFQHFLATDYGITSFPAKADQTVITTPDIVIYPERFFIPFRYLAEFTPDCIEPDTHAIHWFGASWQKKSVVDWLMNKHINPDAKLNRDLDISNVVRLTVFGRRAIIKIIRFDSGKTEVRFLHGIVLFKLTGRRFYMLGIPVLKVKDK